MLRPASTSLAKSPSTAGTLSISSRQRAAETTWRPLAGRICTIGTPLRTTSTSSPASTLLMTCEKFLATSVAVRRVMLEIISDKSDSSAKAPQSEYFS